ncbi:MAG: iron-sulfur cluster repair di-iron protein [Microscillaceae bacterium]|jgi:regulator of cell morphogenesis and NO signaling|nr:iron-sulfur cluster repair di-iron protein [Microscillaceae bacterium]
MATYQSNQTLAEIVLENQQTAEVLSKYQLDFCCGGSQTLAEACAVKNLNIKDLQNELQTISAGNSSAKTNFNVWDLALLSDYIVQKHHHYIIHNVPIIQHLLHKVVDAHADKHPELVEIREIFTELSEELLSHLQKEEVILFPYIKNLAGAEKYNLENPHVCVKTIQNPIKVMETEHEEAGILLKLIRNLSQNYTLPVDACPTYRLVFDKLQTFEKDLFQHIHLENNILFPKALQSERKLLEYITH